MDVGSLLGTVVGALLVKLQEGPLCPPHTCRELVSTLDGPLVGLILIVAHVGLSGSGFGCSKLGVSGPFGF